MNKLCGKSRIMPLPLYAAAQLQPIHALCLQCLAHLVSWIFMIDRQRLTVGSGTETGVVNINYVVTRTANQSSLVTLTFDLKVVPKSHVIWATSANFIFLGLSVLDLGPMYVTRQTDVRHHHCLMPLPIRGWGIINSTNSESISSFYR